MKIKKLYSSFSLIFVVIILFNSLVFAEANSSSANKNVQKEFIESGNGEYVTYSEPPANWNPLKASDEELSYYEYPSRPNTTEDLKTWEKVVSGKWVKPRLSATKKSHAGKFRNSTQMSTTLHYTNANSNLWAGYVKNTTVYGVCGSWIVPTASIDDTQWKGRLAESAQWVGLGGAGLSPTNPTSSLIQIGTDSNVLANGSKKYQSWYEIVDTELNDNTIAINSVPCSPGVMMYGRVYTSFGYDYSSYCDAHFYLSNYSVSTSFIVRIRSYTNSMLQTAEWVTERPQEFDSNGNRLMVIYPVTYTNGLKRTCHYNCQYQTSISGSYSTLTDASNVQALTCHENSTGADLAIPQPLDSTGNFYVNWNAYFTRIQ